MDAVSNSAVSKNLERHHRRDDDATIVLVEFELAERRGRRRVVEATIGECPGNLVRQTDRWAGSICSKKTGKPLGVTYLVGRPALPEDTHAARGARL